MRLTGYAEVWTGTVVIVRGSPAATYQRPDPYQWALVALVNPETGKAEIQGLAKEPLPICRETWEWVLNLIRATGYEPEGQRLRNGELKMSKYGFPHIKEAKAAAGSPVNWKGLEENLKKAQHHEKKGDVEFRDFQVNEEDLGNGDTKLTASIIRHEN